MAKRDYYEVLGVPRPLPPRRSRPPTADWPGRTIPTSTGKTRKPPRKSSRSSRRPTKSWRTRRNADTTTPADSPALRPISDPVGSTGRTSPAPETSRTCWGPRTSSSNSSPRRRAEGSSADSAAEPRAGPGPSSGAATWRCRSGFPCGRPSPAPKRPSTCRGRNRARTARGTGARDGTALETCPECHGTGRIRRSSRSGFTQLISIGECPRCHGTGQRIEERCPTCKGSGRIHEVQTTGGYRPARHRRRLGAAFDRPGRERPDRRTSGRPVRPGDLQPDTRFHREGRQAFTEVTIPLATALLGGEVRVPTITGEVSLKIPRPQPKRQFRLRGEGFPRLRGSDRGDLIVTAHLQLPESLSSRQKELLREALGSPTTPVAKTRSGLFGRRP